MLRGIRTFVCDNCGNKFEGMDCEYMATAYTAPVKCPKCGSMHTYPSGYDIAFLFGGLFGLKKAFYRKMWKNIDSKNKD